MAVSFDKNDNKSRIIAAVEDYFEREELKYTPFNERDVAKASFRIKSKLQHVNVFFSAYNSKLIIRIMLPINSDEAERNKVGEFLMRANYGLQIGCFDYDYNDGEISFRVPLYCGTDEFSPPTYEQIDDSLMVGIMMVDKYGNSLIKVIFGLLEPEEAIEEAENND